MFFDGERNSVPVDVCGASVPLVADDVVVVDVAADDVVVELAGADVLVGLPVVDVVVPVVDGPLEHAANDTAAATSTRPARVRREGL